MNNTKPLDAQIATWMVRPLCHTTLSPNHLTSVRLIVGLAAALAFAIGGSGLAHMGACLFALSCLLDHTDGEFARMTNQQSRFGHLYDLASDALVTVLLFAGIGWGLRLGSYGHWTVLMGFAAGLAIAFIFHLRYVIEENLGKTATHQPRIGLFELEDILYLLPLVTYFDQLQSFLVTAAIGAPIAACLVGLQYRVLSKQWKK